MIGTRHEKAVIVLTSYVIGFTTAFITFGISAMGSDDYKMETKNHSGVNRVVEFKATHKNISAIGEDELGLYVTVGNYNRIISGNKNDLSASVIESISGPGYAVKQHQPTVSPDGWFAFYCEQEEEDSVECNPYVYNLFDDTVHKATLNGQYGSLDIATFTSSWSEDSLLTVNGYQSNDNKSPWLFTAEEITPEEEVSASETIPTDSNESALLEEEVKPVTPEVQVDPLETEDLQVQ